MLKPKPMPMLMQHLDWWLHILAPVNPLQGLRRMSQVLAGQFVLIVANDCQPGAAFQGQGESQLHPFLHRRPSPNRLPLPPVLQLSASPCSSCVSRRREPRAPRSGSRGSFCCLRGRAAPNVPHEFRRPKPGAREWREAYLLFLCFLGGLLDRLLGSFLLLAVLLVPGRVLYMQYCVSCMRI